MMEAKLPQTGKEKHKTDRNKTARKREYVAS
jgi:hypothetical protein